MKYLLIFFLSFIFINPALAAKAVKGTVPQLKPLQPAPAGIFPAYSKNIQHQDANYVPSNGSVNAVPRPDGNQQLEPSPVPGQPPATAALAQSSPARHYVWWIIVLLAAFALGFLAYKRRRRDKVIP
jgi:hypothetical protein